MSPGPDGIPEDAQLTPWFRDLLRGRGEAKGLAPELRRALAVVTVGIAAEQGREKREIAQCAADAKLQRERERAEDQARVEQNRLARAGWRERGDELHLYFVDLTSNRPWDTRDGDWRADVMERLARADDDEPIVHTFHIGVGENGTEGLVAGDIALARWVRFPAKRRRYVRVPDLAPMVDALYAELDAHPHRRTLVIVLHPQLRSGSNRWTLRPSTWDGFQFRYLPHVAGVLHMWPCALPRVSLREMEVYGARIRATFGLSQSEWRKARKPLPALVEAFVAAGSAAGTARSR